MDTARIREGNPQRSGLSNFIQIKLWLLLLPNLFQDIIDGSFSVIVSLILHSLTENINVILNLCRIVISEPVGERALDFLNLSPQVCRQRRQQIGYLSFAQLFPTQEFSVSRQGLGTLGDLAKGITVIALSPPEYVDEDRTVIE